MSDIAIRVDGLGKRYRIGTKEEAQAGVGSRIRGLATSPFSYLRRMTRPPTEAETFWALKDVSFEIQRGDVVGVIGRNGAGKSTLLKILSRITEPSCGRAEVHGRVGSLLEVGTGFHPELTGRENIYLNGAILGMRRIEIARKFDEIVAFAEIDRFLDTPVKRYSSGMYVRLAFAVAAHLEPEILLVDEVLAVGDATFQKKCLGKIGDVVSEGRTVLFVSHNMAIIQALCQKAVFLSNGGCVGIGITESVIADYMQSVVSEGDTCLDVRTDRQGDGKLRFVEFRVYGQDAGRALVCGGPATLQLDYEAQSASRLKNVNVSIGLNTLLDENVLYLSNELVGVQFSDLARRGRLVCQIDKLPLVAGSYTINLYCTVNGTLADWIINAARISVEQGDYYGTGRLTPESHTKILVPHGWYNAVQE